MLQNPLSIPTFLLSVTLLSVDLAVNCPVFWHVLLIPCIFFTMIFRFPVDLDCVSLLFLYSLSIWLVLFLFKIEVCLFSSRYLFTFQTTCIAKWSLTLCYNIFYHMLDIHYLWYGFQTSHYIERSADHLQYFDTLLYTSLFLQFFSLT